MTAILSHLHDAIEQIQRLFSVITRFEAVDLFPRAAHRNQFLRQAFLVLFDNGVGHFQNGGRGTIVVQQLNHLGIGETALEVKDDTEIRPPPAVNRLIDVTHHG